MTMAYIAQKPCRLAGQAFLIGDIVPDEVIHPGNAKNLLKMGIIAEAGGELATGTLVAEEGAVSAPLVITIHAKEGDLELEPTAEGIQAVFDVLTASAKDVEPTIKAMTDADALILLDLTDSRKTVKELARDRALEISQEGEESEGDH
jgi:hypothetical protein